jgi:hypothetical protein
MPDLASQIVTIVAVVLGAVGTLSVTAFTDRIRWRREQRARFYERRLALCTEFAASTRQIVQVLSGVTAIVRNGATTPLIGIDDARYQLIEATNRQVIAWESLRLVADRATTYAVRDVWRATTRLSTTTFPLDDFDHEAWDRAREGTRLTREHFYEVARASLGDLGLDESLR